MSVNEKMTAIADAIRDKTGGTDALTLDGMAEAIPEVHEAGKKAEWSDFWEYAQKDNQGNPYTYLPYAFAGWCWDNNTFKPKYDIKPAGSANGIFRQCRIVNLKQCLESCGVVLDLSRCTSLTAGFGYTGDLKVLPKLDLSAITGATQVFSGDTALETIEEIKFGKNTAFSQTFDSCTSLTHMIVTGVIGKNGLDLHWSTKLTHESLMSVLNALEDKTSVGSTWTVTLGAENLAKLTDAEKAIATQKGWTLV